MTDVFHTFIEVFICFFSAVGILYLLRDLYLTLFYYKKRASFPILLPINDLSCHQINEWLYEGRIILQQKRARAYLGKFLLVHDEALPMPLTPGEIQEINDYYEDIARFISKDELIKFIRETDHGADNENT